MTASRRLGAVLSRAADQLVSEDGELFLVSAVFLFLELALIRWLPAHVLFLTFFTNTVLLASFLGFSLGCVLAQRQRNYFILTPIFLTVTVAAGIGMEWVRLTLQDLIDVGGNKAAPQIVYFGSEARVADVASFAIPMECVAGLFFVLVAITLMGLGQVVGRRFGATPHPVKAYAINVAGSLAGVCLFYGCSLWLSPIWWFGLVAVGLAHVASKEGPSRRWAIGVSILVPILLLIPKSYTIGVIRERFPVELWSPYYRINYSPDSGAIVANLLGHQQMVSRRDPFPAYAIPYLLNRDAGQPPFRDILIIGAGSGNDVSRALAWAAPDAHVDAVEIDPVIYSLGSRYHADRPFQDARVTVHVTDGRNFLRSSHRKYDLIVYALVDSLVLHSSVSDIHLESFLFTRQAMADIREHLQPAGLFVMYNYFRQGWIVSRLVKTAQFEFHQLPVVLMLPQQDEIAARAKAEGFTLLFEGPRADAIHRAFQDKGAYLVLAGYAPGPSSPDGFGQSGGKGWISLSPAKVEIPVGLRMAEDNWPFLYVRNPMVPALSLRGIAVMGLAAFAMLWFYGGRPGGGGRFARLDAAMVLLGCGFMLLETKAVVHMALVLGSTWTVNAVVFSAVLVMILAANVSVLKWRPLNPTLFYIGLLAALGLNLAIPLDSLLGWSRALQAAATALLVLSPIFFAGAVFAVQFGRGKRPEEALAYNTVGAMLGGFAEAASMLIGFQYLLGVAALIYLASWLCWGTGPSSARR